VLKKYVKKYIIEENNDITHGLTKIYKNIQSS